MAAQQRRHLEQLMGTGDGVENADLSDPRLCRSFCVEFCVYDIMSGTKSPLGTCTFMHLERARMLYRARSEPIPEFEAAFNTQLERVLRLCDRRIRDAEAKLRPEPTLEQLTALRDARDAAASAAEETKFLSAEIVALGTQGEIRRACHQIDILKDAHNQQARLDDAVTHARERLKFSPHLRLQVCKVCGSLLSSLDSDVRLADHFVGKLHRSHALVQETAVKRHLIPDPNISGEQCGT